MTLRILHRYGPVPRCGTSTVDWIHTFPRSVRSQSGPPSGTLLPRREGGYLSRSIDQRYRLSAGDSRFPQQPLPRVTGNAQPEIPQVGPQLLSDPMFKQFDLEHKDVPGFAIESNPGNLVLFSNQT